MQTSTTPTPIRRRSLLHEREVTVPLCVLLWSLTALSYYSRLGRYCAR